MKRVIVLFLVVIFFVSCKDGGQSGVHLSKIKGKQIDINEDINANEAIEKMVKPYKEKLAKEMSEILSYTPVDLKETDGELECTMGNLLADLCYEQAQPIFKKRTQNAIDFVLLNHGGIRAEISKGNITVSDAFKVMPFENDLVVVELTPQKIDEMVQYLIKAKRAHPLSKQVRLKIDKKGGYSLTINGEKLKNDRNYYVLTSDFLQGGGDYMLFLKNPVNLFPLDYKIRNAMIDYLRKNKEINVKLDGRFTLQN